MGPTYPIALMLSTLGGPVVLAGIPGVITLRTLSLGGIDGPTATMSEGQVHSLGRGVTQAAVVGGPMRTCRRHCVRCSSHSPAGGDAQEVKEIIDAGDM